MGLVVPVPNTLAIDPRDPHLALFLSPTLATILTLRPNHLPLLKHTRLDGSTSLPYSFTGVQGIGLGSHPHSVVQSSSTLFLPSLTSA